VRLLAWVFALLLVLALVEAVLLVRSRRGVRLADSLSNLGCGLGQIVTRPLYDAGFVLVYLAVFDRARIATAPARSLGTWVVTLFVTDFLYYAYHRLAHGTRLMWAWHGVHHQSESYDLSVSFRLSWLGPPAEKLFYLPLAFAGLPVEAVLAATAYSSFYQFFVHTRAVPKLGPLDWVLNTPSNHRVHHGVEPKYIDKNFAGMFVIWDRLFGTYQPEEEEPTYGVPRAFESKNPLVANIAYFVEWARGVERLLPVPVRASRAPAPLPILLSAAALLAVLSGLTLGCFAWAREGDLAVVAVVAVVVLVGVSSVGFLLDSPRAAPVTHGDDIRRPRGLNGDGLRPR
jgi:sterol desaturase/sphingolipid hydroxylase (fatty acid hydroxylase superfamily)